MLKRLIARSPRGEYTCLIDKAFNELLDVHDDNFSELFSLLTESLKVSIAINRDQPISEDLLYSSNMFVLGCPTRVKLEKDDIELIVKYVREGGNLLVISDAGGDLANKSNMNDLVNVFGIEIESTTVRDSRNVGSAVSPMLDNINIGHVTNKNVIRLVAGGATTLLIQEPAVTLFATGKTSVIEKYSPRENNAWKIMKVGENYPLASACMHGQGKVVVCGDVDMFSDDPEFGINAFDNGTFIKNIFSWFLAPVETSTVIDWLISRVASLEEKCDALAQKYDALALENEKLKKMVKEVRPGEGEYSFIKNDTAENLG
ncbi:MAG TPA: hypothetical protein VKM55_25920 [Candidatus Lokiarchaeia archaeon]|nr:hypothetical protein [Candidatus Lokiarchaeia archaeon]